MNGSNCQLFGFNPLGRDFQMEKSPIPHIKPSLERLQKYFLFSAPNSPIILEKFFTPMVIYINLILTFCDTKYFESICFCSSIIYFP